MRRLAFAVVMLVALTTPIQAQDAVPAFSEGVAAYESGDYATALRIFKVHAALGDAYAQNNLGLVYGNGQGVPQDYVRAYMWFGLAAAQGDERARKNRNIVAEQLTPDQIIEAQKLAREWMEKHGQ